MNNLSTYITEKLHLNKNIEIEQDNFKDNLYEEIINYVTGKLHYEYKNDYEFNIKPQIKDTSIICKVVINLHNDILNGYTNNKDFERFCDFITKHLNSIFKDKKFTYNCELKLKEIDIYVRNKE